MFDISPLTRQAVSQIHKSPAYLLQFTIDSWEHKQWCKFIKWIFCVKSGLFCKYLLVNRIKFVIGLFYFDGTVLWWWGSRLANMVRLCCVLCQCVSSFGHVVGAFGYWRVIRGQSKGTCRRPCPKLIIIY